MTFCGFKDCKHFNNGCHRSLTDEVIKRARKAELLIAQFIDKPDCHEYRDEFVQNEDIVEGIEK